MTVDEWTSDRGQGEAQEKLVDELTEYLRSALAVEVASADTDYFALGLVDSLRSLELVTHLEIRFDIVVEVEDLALDNFRTVNRMAEFVQAKLAATAPRGGIENSVTGIAAQ